MPERRPFVAANWKMHTDRSGAVRLALETHEGLSGGGLAVDAAVCPPFVYLDAVGQALAGVRSPLALGAQNACDQPSGAFTGEVSPGMLADLRVRYVIIGHSERRRVYGESDELIARKVRAVLGAGLDCILCIGETIEERRAGRADGVNERQLRAALSGLGAEAAPRLTIAYEPVWAIGTGVTATPDDAQAAHASIRRVLAALLGGEAARAMRIQYGGSVKPDNAAELFAQPDIDGGLVGGASLKAEDFLAIVRAAAGSGG